MTECQKQFDTQMATQLAEDQKRFDSQMADLKSEFTVDPSNISNMMTDKLLQVSSELTRRKKLVKYNQFNVVTEKKTDKTKTTKFIAVNDDPDHDISDNISSPSVTFPFNNNTYSSDHNKSLETSNLDKNLLRIAFNIADQARVVTDEKSTKKTLRTNATIDSFHSNADSDDDSYAYIANHTTKNNTSSKHNFTTPSQNINFWSFSIDW